MPPGNQTPPGTTPRHSPTPLPFAPVPFPPCRYPPFEWGTVGFLYMASCASASAQELLVRGYGGQVLAGWWTGLLAGATDPSNPLYWAKVRREGKGARGAMRTVLWKVRREGKGARGGSCERYCGR